MRPVRCDVVDALLEPLDPVCDLVCVVQASPRRVSGGTCARDMFDTSGEVVEAQLHLGEIIRTIIVVRDGLRLGFPTGCLLQNDGIEPFIQRQPGPARRSLGGFASFISNTFDAPRKPKSHAHTRIRGGVAESPDRLSRNRGTLMTG